jgi:hypothetical protein
MSSMAIPMGGQNMMFGSGSNPGTFQFGGAGFGAAPTSGGPVASPGGGFGAQPLPGGSLTTNPTGVQGGGTTGAGAPVLQFGGQQPMQGQGSNPFSQKPQQAMSTSAVGTGMPTPTPSLTTGQQTLNNLTGTTAGTPSTVTGENGQTTTQANNYGQSGEQQNRTLGELQNYYGEGMGSLIYNLLQNGGMNTGLVNSTDAAMIQGMQGQINQGSGNLNNLLGAEGVSANSSSSLLANSNYQSQVTSQENAQIAQTYLQQYDVGQQLLNNVLGNTMNVNAQGTANQSNWMDDIGSALNIAGDFSSVFSSIPIPGM